MCQTFQRSLASSINASALLHAESNQVIQESWLWCKNKTEMSTFYLRTEQNCFIFKNLISEFYSLENRAKFVFSGDSRRYCKICPNILGRSLVSGPRTLPLHFSFDASMPSFKNGLYLCIYTSYACMCICMYMWNSASWVFFIML